MDFNLKKDFIIFDPLFSSRPKLSPERLKEDLVNYYLPFVQNLINLKNQQEGSDGFIVGISAIQGAGKTTQGEILDILLKHFGFCAVSLSIDDHYVTHKKLCEIRFHDPRFIRRGVTHDIPLALQNLTDLEHMLSNEPVLISGYDKGAHGGDGDRFRWVVPDNHLTIKLRVIREELVINKKPQVANALHLTSLMFNNSPINLPVWMGSDIPVVEGFLPSKLINFLNETDGEITISMPEQGIAQFSTPFLDLTVSIKDLPNGWKLIPQKPDFIFYDGWMLGARMVQDETVFDQNLPGLETDQDRQFAKDINKKLAGYDILWKMIDFMNVLYVPNYQISLTWRDMAEQVLREKGEGLNEVEIKEFVHYFWRSVHPAIQIKNLAQDIFRTQQVVVINDDHSIKEILAPLQVKAKYP